MTEPYGFATTMAVDAVKGTLVERVVKPALAPILEVVRPLAYPWWDASLHEIRLRLSEAAEELRTKDSGVVEALTRSLQEGEADALVLWFLRAAAQATTQARMKMLAAAAAGVLTPDMDSEDRSRVSRAVVELEATDVRYLRSLVSDIGDRTSFDLLPEYEGLFKAGCIAPRGFGGGGMRGAYVTRTGRAVLVALRRWKAEPNTRK